MYLASGKYLAIGLAWILLDNHLQDIPIYRGNANDNMLRNRVQPIHYVAKSFSSVNFNHILTNKLVKIHKLSKNHSESVRIYVSSLAPPTK